MCVINGTIYGVAVYVFGGVEYVIMGVEYVIMGVAYMIIVNIDVMHVILDSPTIVTRYIKVM